MLISEKMKKKWLHYGFYISLFVLFPASSDNLVSWKVIFRFRAENSFFNYLYFFGFLGSGFIIYTWLCACILFLGIPHQFNTLIKLFLGFDACLILLGFNILPGKKQDFLIFLWHDRLDGRIMNLVDEVLILNPQSIKTVPL